MRPPSSLSHTNKALAGFTLTEMALVLGIVGLVLGGVWVGARSLNDNLKIKSASEALQTIVQNIRSAMGLSRGFSSILGQDITDNLIRKNVFGADYLSNLSATANTTHPLDQNLTGNTIRVLVGPTNQNQLLIQFLFPNTLEDRANCNRFVLSNLNTEITQIQNGANSVVPTNLITAASFNCPVLAAPNVFVAGFVLNLK